MMIIYEFYMIILEQSVANIHEVILLVILIILEVISAIGIKDLDKVYL